MTQGGNYSFGRDGFSPEGLRRYKRFYADLRRQARERERDRIAVLSDNDIVKIMARAIADAANRRGEVQRRDFHQAGIPDARIDRNFDAAMARARRRDAALDAMAVQP